MKKYAEMTRTELQAELELVQKQYDALKEQHGIEIEKNRIVQGDPIKSFGNYEVKVKFGFGIDGTLHLMVIEK